MVADFNDPSRGLKDGKPANAHCFPEPDLSILIREHSRTTQETDA